MAITIRGNPNRTGHRGLRFSKPRARRHKFVSEMVNLFTFAIDCTLIAFFASAVLIVEVRLMDSGQPVAVEMME